MSVKFSNNATTELASSIGTSDTSITVVDASKFPILTAGDYTYVTLDTDTASPTREIVKVTAIAGNVLTVTRGQDGTSPASFAAGTKVELRLTAALLNDVAGANPSGEPIGFPDKSQTTITFDSGIRTFSITPTGTSFDVYCKGVKYTYTTVQLVTIPNTTGLHFIYFSASGVLSTQMSYFTWEEHAPTAYVYWNATTQQAIYFGDERHGITLDWQTHEYLHRTRGAAIANGFAASGYTTTGIGATNADAQIDIGGGTFFDEDMQVDIVSTNTPVAGTWQQDLSGPARIPVMYLSGAAWVIDSPTNFPFKVVSGVPQYNLLSGSTWSTASVTNNSYFVSWILATNNLTYPVISIISQAPTNQLSVAEAMTFEGLNLNGFPSVEFRPLYKVIYQYKDGFANSVKSSTIAVYDLRSISSAGVAAALVQDHGNLSGLTDDDHPQYVHTSEVRTPSAAVKNSFFPSQVGQTGKYLSTDGTNTVWEPAPSGSLSFTGDVTGTGSTGSSVAMTLAASGVVAGQYTKVTVDAKGRVTAGTSVTSSDVTTALGYTPYNATNPAGYTTNVGTVTSVSGTGTVSGLTLTGSVTSSGSLTLGGTLSLTSGQVTSALGFTPYNATNPSGYITGITSGMVTTALGYTPYNSSNPSGYITSSSNITGTAAGITGYTLADVTGTATSVMTRNSSGDSAVGSRFHFTTCTADGGNFALVGLNWGGAAGTYKDFEVYDYPNSRPLFRAFGSTRNFEVFGALTVGGNTALHAANYNSYAPTLTGTGASGTWGINISGNAATATTASNSTNLGGNASSYYDQRAYNVANNYLGAYYVGGGEKPNDAIFGAGKLKLAMLSSGNLGFGGSWNDVLWLSSYSGGDVKPSYAIVGDKYSDELWFSRQNYDSATWGTGRRILHSGNFSSYVLPLSGGTLTGTLTGTTGRFQKNQTAGDYTTAALWTESYGNTATGVAFHISGNVGKFLEMRTNGILYWNGDTVIHSGNYSSYALPLSGGTVSGNTTFTTSLTANTGITVNAASSSGYGINLYSGSSYQPTYGLFFATTGNFGTYGAVSADWATYFTMNSTAHRGWIFREHDSLGNVAAISNQGNMTLRSHFEQGNNIARPNVSWSASSNSTGMVIFYLPGTTANYGMVHMVFDIYEYNSNAVSTVIVGGHNWSTSWYNTGCSVIGQCGKSVRLGVKDGRFCVVFGTSGSVWEYGTIVLRKIHNGSFYDNIMNMVGDWSATQTATESFTNITGDLRNLRTPSSLEVGTIGYAYQSFRSPIFYDYDDTTYYVDPASTSLSLSSNGIVSSGAGTAGGFQNRVFVGGRNRIWSFGNADAYGISYFQGSLDYIGFHYGTATQAASQFWVNASGTAQASGDFRAPIFYDSNNTGYYVDPASTSILSTVLIAGTIRNNGSVSDDDNFGLYFDSAASTAYAIYREPGSWTHPYPDLRIAFHTGIKIGANSSYQGVRFYTDYDMSSQVMSVNNGSDPLGGGNVYVNNNLQAGSSLRAPIFYDSDNTGYYLDPLGTSELNRINTVRTNNWLYIDQNYGHSVVGVYTSVRYQGVWAMGDSYKLPADGTTTGNLYGLAWSHPNTGGVAANLASHGLLLLEAGSFKGAWGGGSFRTPGDVRGTIFYDYDNTGYYLDPTSTTSLRTVGDWRADAASWTGEFSGKIQYHSSNWYFQSAGGWQFRNSAGSQLMYVDSGGNATFNGNVTAYSDRRLKENVRDLIGAQTYLDKISAKRFTWKGDGCEDIGFIAQDVEAAGLTEFVLETAEYDPNTESTSDPVKTLDYGRMVSVLWQAVKEQNIQITAMSAEINSLKERLH